jgi:hypothetical protein
MIGRDGLDSFEQERHLQLAEVERLDVSSLTMQTRAGGAGRDSATSRRRWK